MQEEFIALLLATPALQGVVSDRIYWGMAPQEEVQTPYVVLTLVDSTPDYHLRGPSGRVMSRVQCDAYAESYTAATTAARAIIARLSGFKSGVFQGIFMDAMRDLPAADPGQVTTLFRVSVDFFVHHSA